LCIELRKWYVVTRGRVPEVYDKWDDCSQQVIGFSGCSFKGFKSREEAEARWMNHLEEERKKNPMKTVMINRMKTFTVIPAGAGLLTVISVLFYLFFR
jgi:viroplasmin and RNaseH domain-containing protein